jgi:hypothetical protein
MGFDGKKKWILQWYRSGQKIKTSDNYFDSPNDALRAVAEIKQNEV